MTSNIVACEIRSIEATNEYDAKENDDNENDHRIAIAHMHKKIHILKWKKL